jgi:hypothetical protein
MVLNLDQFDERRQIAADEWDLSFIAFNPTAEPRESELVFPLAVERAATITCRGATGATSAPLSAGRYSMRLEPGEMRWLNVVVPSGVPASHALMENRA